MSETRGKGEESFQEKGARSLRERAELDKAERVRDLERKEVARKRAQQPDGSQEMFLAQVNLVASPEEDPTRDRHTQAQSRRDLSPNLDPVRVDRPLGSHDIVQRESRASAGISEFGTSSIRHPIPEASGLGTGDIGKGVPLEYYRELYIPADHSAESLLYDMDLEQLCDFAGVLEHNPEDDVRPCKLLSSIYCFIFSRTDEVDDIQKAIDRAEEAVRISNIDDQDHAVCLRNLIVVLMKKYECTRSLEDLERATLRAEEMVTVTPPLHSHRRYRVNDLILMRLQKSLQTRSEEDYYEAMFVAAEATTAEVTATAEAALQARSSWGLSIYHWDRFQHTNDINNLHMAIKIGEEVVAAIPSDQPDRARRLSILALFFQTRFEQLKDLNDLYPAIEKAEEAVAIISLNHPDRAVMLGNLARSFQSKYLQTDELNNLDMAIKNGEEAIVSTSYNHSEKARWLSNQESYLHTRFLRTGNFIDLDMAIKYAEEAVILTPHHHYQRAAKLSNLAENRRIRFERTSNLNDLYVAVERAEEAVRLTPHDHHDRATILVILANCSITMFKQMGNLNDLYKSIRSGEESVTLTPYDHPDRVSRLSNLDALYQIRFQRTGDLNDLDVSMERIEEAVAGLAGTSHSHQDVALILGNSSNTFHTRFQRTGDLNDLYKAVRKGEEAVALAPYDPRWRVILASILCSMFQQTNGLNYLERAIARIEEAIAVTSDNHYGRGTMIHNLALFFRIRSERTGNIDDLNMSIKKGEEALRAIPANHPEKPHWMGSIAGSFQTRFERMGDLNDLNTAIKAGEKAITLMGPTHSHPYRADITGLLAVSYYTRSRRLDDLSDLHIAITKGEEAVTLQSHNYHSKSGKLSNLTLFLRTRSEWTSNLNDLHAAIERGEEAVGAIASDNHYDKALIQSNLAVSLRTRFEWTHDLNDLDMAIEKGEEVLAATPDDHQDKARSLNNLAMFFRTRCDWTSNPDDSKQALRHWVAATDLHNAPPRHRINSALYAAQELANKKEWSEASRITEIAVNLLPKVAPRQLKQRDQQHTLGEFGSLAALAASTALKAGKDASHAVQLLEVGRGIVTGLRLGTRSDLTELRKQHKDKAEKFERLRDALDSGEPLSAIAVDMSTSISRRSRHDASLELDKIIIEICHLTNFKNFLKPLQASELMGAASSGPIVIINVSFYYCDALLVKREGIRALPLPLLQLSDIKKRVARFNPSTDLLEWLWKTTASPILDELGFRKTPAGEWPHIWWIPTGLMSRLPIHAAGYHYANSSDTVLDRVISSYSPSIKGLVYARQNTMKKDLNVTSGRVLLVSMPTTPRNSNLKPSELRFAEKEIEVLEELLPTSTPKDKPKQPRKKDIVGNLESCTMFHFAGHGASHPLDPSKSCLLLHDWVDSPLTVEDLAGLKLYQKTPWLAYLSACSTGENQAANLQDETIHLVNACQLAGFPHVIGSLWEVDDEYSVDAAREVYTTLRDKGWNNEVGALSVHNAARFLRGKTRGVSWGVGYATREEGNPSIWAAYIHVGP